MLDLMHCLAWSSFRQYYLQEVTQLCVKEFPSFRSYNQQRKGPVLEGVQQSLDYLASLLSALQFQNSKSLDTSQILLREAL